VGSARAAVACSAGAFGSVGSSAVGTDQAQLNGRLGLLGRANRPLALRTPALQGYQPRIQNPMPRKRGRKEQESLPSCDMWSVYGVEKYEAGPPLVLLWVITLAPLPTVEALDMPFEGG
jgi:hypothetical protein